MSVFTCVGRHSSLIFASGLFPCAVVFDLTPLYATKCALSQQMFCLAKEGRIWYNDGDTARMCAALIRRKDWNMGNFVWSKRKKFPLWEADAAAIGGVSEGK